MPERKLEEAEAVEPPALRLVAVRMHRAAATIATFGFTARPSRHTSLNVVVLDPLLRLVRGRRTRRSGHRSRSCAARWMVFGSNTLPTEAMWRRLRHDVGAC
ncbi:MAG: hypothetical protein U5Q44_06970 [Dehalococcoidia bacterium]|nr:hypothetical protein [Dehalococcoidia bacterium]